MRKTIEKLGLETILGAIFGVIAIIAVIFEMQAANFDYPSIAGGIKDIAGTMAAVMVFVFAIKNIHIKNAKGFDNVLKEELEKILQKYSPIIQLHGEKEAGTYANTIRYDIANKLNAISTNAPGAFNLFFRITPEEVDSIEFKFTPTVFGDRHELVASRVQGKISIMFKEYISNIAPTTDHRVKITFANVLKNDKDALLLVQIIDCVLLICVSEYGIGKQ